MQKPNKAHNFPPYHIGNAPRRKPRGVSFILLFGVLIFPKRRRASAFSVPPSEREVPRARKSGRAAEGAGGAARSFSDRAAPPYFIFQSGRCPFRVLFLLREHAAFHEGKDDGIQDARAKVEEMAVEKAQKQHHTDH